MRVVKLEAENFKRLKAVVIEPGDQNVVILAGRNAQGKSSALDAIWAALGGKSGVVARPVRDGERKAQVTIDLGDMIVTRKWSGERTTLEVAAASGAKFPSPQRMLDDLVGRLSFDPLAFSLMEPKKQLATLIDLAELPFDPDDLAARRKAAYDERTDANREVKSIKARLDALPRVTMHGVRVDVAQLAGELQAATQAKERRDALLAEHRRNAAEIERLTARQAEIVAEGAPLKEWADRVETLVLRLSEADEVNKAADIDDRRNELEEDLDNFQAASESHTATIERLDREKEEGLAKAKFPIDGLGFDEEGVLYNGVPFSQASAAERLRVSVAMAMAMNPQARIILIRDGSLLDSENMALIESMAADNDFQCWIERVDESGEIGVVIEDGEVKA